MDVDGVSPVTFNNLANGNYILDCPPPQSSWLTHQIKVLPQTINETKSTAFTTNVIDLRTATDAQLYGTSAAYTTATHPVLTTVNLLWGGNANFNTNTRFTSLNNDRDYLLVNTLGNNPATVLSNIYHSADVNMNRIVRFTSLNNDRDLILVTALGNAPATVRTQAIPN